ncbi:tetratricopeptide repeat protein [Desulfobacterales bacterium HSG2]|nr:tetratricopeptide repeat protein [Desulfobacterales bacterium HSG2]
MNETEKKINALNEKIVTEPENAVNYLTRGDCYSSLKRYEKALNDYNRAIELNPEEALYYNNRGASYDSLERYEEALNDYNRAIELDHEEALYYSNRGVSYHSLERYEEALNDYARAIELNPEDIDYYDNRAHCYYSFERYEEALNDYNRAIELDPENSETYRGRGDCYSDLERYEEALNDYNRAIELDPEDSEAYRGRGDCYSDIENYDKAITDYIRAIELYPENNDAYRGRGVCYYFIDDYAKAIADCTRAIELDPEDIEAYVGIGNCYYSMENYAKAMVNYTKAVEINPENNLAYSGRGDCYSANDNYAEAIANYTKAIELDSEDELAYHGRGDCYYFMDNYTEAIADYTKAIEFDPEEFDFYQDRGNCYYFMDKYADAITDYTKLIELDPERRLPYFFRADCYCKINEEKKSLDDLSSFKEKSEKNQGELYKYIFEGKGEYGKELGDIVKDSSMTFMLKAMEILLDLKELDFYNENYLRIANFLDNSNFKEKNFPEDTKNLLFQIFQHYPKFEGSLQKIFARDGKELFFIRSKLSILANISDRFNKKIPIRPKEEKAEKTKKKFNQQADFTSLCYTINHVLQEKNVELVEKKKIAQAKVDERNKVIQDLSHHIKNLTSKIIDPLENLKQEKFVKTTVIENALRGANLIREIMNAMNLSFEGSIDDFHYDACNNTDNENASLHSILSESLKYSVGNMFDGKHFSKFMKAYFPSKSVFKEAKPEWTQISQSINLEEIIPYLQKHFFDIDLSFDNAINYVIGNDKGSAIKLLILSQELILNAVKYSAFISRENRFLDICFSDTPEEISIKVVNPYDEKLNIKTSGIGHVIVENFSKLLNTEPIIDSENGVYSVEIKFANLWKEV